MLSQGAVDALIFAMDKTNRRYAPDLSEDEMAQMIAHAEGRLGTNFAYLDSMVRHLGQLGIVDAEMCSLLNKVNALRA